MNTRISPREWEALSAYLDGQLPSRERERLESRLDATPELRHALEALSQTRSVLRGAPKLRAPRNFTLSPEMAGMRPGARPISGAYPVLRLASVLAALFFVVVFVGELVAQRFQSEPLLVAQAPQQQLAQPAWPAMGMGGGGGGGAEAPEAEFEAPVEAIVPEGEAAATEGALMKESAPADEATEAMNLVVTPLERAVTTPIPMETPVAEDAAEIQEEPLPVEPPAPALAPGAQVQPTPPPDAEAPSPPGWPVLRVLQVALALLAVGCGLGAIYLRRSARA